MELREQIRPGPFLVGRLLCVLGVPVDKRLVTVSSPLFFAVTRQNTQSRGKLQANKPDSDEDSEEIRQNFMSTFDPVLREVDWRTIGY